MICMSLWLCKLRITINHMARMSSAMVAVAVRYVWIFGGEFEMLPNIKHVHSASCRHRHPADIYISQEVQLTLTTPRDACTKVVEYEHHSSVLSKPYQIRNTYILFVQKLYMVGQNLRTWRQMTLRDASNSTVYTTAKAVSHKTCDLSSV